MFKFEFTITDAAEQQAEALLELIMQYCETYDMSMAGGFAPVKEDDDDKEEQTPQSEA